MITFLAPILIMLTSSAMYSLSYVLQHTGTQASIGERAGSDAGVAKLVRNPTWLLGVVLFGLSFALHLVALAFGSVGMVQPLIIAEIVFIPPIAQLISKVKVGARDWLAILLVSVSLALFLVVARPTEGDPTAPLGDWLAVITVMLASAGLIMWWGSRQRNTSAKASIIGVGAGIFNALLAISAKGMFGSLVTAGFVGNPLTYVTVVVTVGSIGTTAFAFRSGPITASSCAMIAVNPIVSTVAAMWLFHVEIKHTPLDVVGIVISIMAMNLGIIALSRSRFMHFALGS